MTSRRPPPSRRHSAGTRAWPRWPLGVACLVLAAGGAYWLAAEPAERAAEPARGPARRSARREARANEPEQRATRAAQPGGTTGSPRRPPASPAEPELEDDGTEPPPAETPHPLAAPEADEPATHATVQPHAAAAAPAENEETPHELAPEREPAAKPRPRRLELTELRRWKQPGLCSRTEQATAAQQTLMSHFRAAELASGARIFLDPRLPAGAEVPALGYLEEAQRILQAELQLTPGLPDVFLYQDVQLLLASACTNADVVAYYDGALHVVVTRDDVRESVLHEFTHHALMTAGVIGPAWVQEGLAMHVARETWWRRPDLLQRLLERPFALSIMETIVPYTLENEQAALFYVQAAAMVECATREPDSTLNGLLRELNVQRSGDTLDYGLPALAELTALRDCVRELLQEPAPAPTSSPSR